MKAPRKSPSEDFDDPELMSDGDLDLDDFIDAMEEETELRHEPRSPRRPGWRRVDDLRDSRWLREQLNDWEDWEK